MTVGPNRKGNVGNWERVPRHLRIDRESVLVITWLVVRFCRACSLTLVAFVILFRAQAQSGEAEVDVQVCCCNQSLQPANCCGDACPAANNGISSLTPWLLASAFIYDAPRTGSDHFSQVFLSPSRTERPPFPPPKAG
jgi:hypothetical protein